MTSLKIQNNSRVEQNPKDYFSHVNPNPPQLKAFIHCLQSKKNIDSSDIYQICLIIEKQHINIWTYFERFFSKLRTQLIISDQGYRQSVKNSQYFSQIDKINTQIKFTKYFKNGQAFHKEVFEKLFQSFNKKIQFYTQQKIAQYFCQNQQKYLKNQRFKTQTSQPILDETIISYLFPESYSLYKTLKDQLQFMKSSYLLNKNQDNFVGSNKKDRIVEEIVKNQFNTKNQGSYVIQQSDLHMRQQLNEEEFYQAKLFIQKVRNQANLANAKDGPLVRVYDSEFKSIPIKCIGCAPFLYEGKPIPRDRSSISNFQTLRAKNDKQFQSRLKQLIQNFLNSPNGGFILFDCDDFQFQIFPDGFETNLKNYESKKQSIIDVCKNLFKDFVIDKDYAIDFILIYDKHGNPVQPKNEFLKQQSKEQNTGYFVTRMKIFSRPINRQLRVSQRQNYKISSQVVQTQSRIDSMIIATQLCPTMVKSITYEQMKLQFYKGKLNEESLQIQVPEKFEQVKKAFYGNEQKIVELMTGRMTKFQLHEAESCMPPQLLAIRSHIQTKTGRDQSNQSNSITNLGKDQKEPQDLKSMVSLQRQFKHWTLLIVNVGQIKRVQNQLQQLFRQKKFTIEAPFKDRFHNSKNTLLIKSMFKQDELAAMIKSPQAKDNNYLRIYSKGQGYIPLKYIKVYDYIEVIYKRVKSIEELSKVMRDLEKELISYFSNSSCQEYVPFKRIKIRMFCVANSKGVPVKETVYITTFYDEQKYGVLFLYSALRNWAITDVDVTMKKIQFREKKDETHKTEIF